MNLSEIKSLSTDDVDRLLSDARKGVKEAAINFVRFSVWRSVSQEKALSDVEREYIFNQMFDHISLSVEVI